LSASRVREGRLKLGRRKDAVQGRPLKQEERE
jgi:hypothetical protein